MQQQELDQPTVALVRAMLSDPAAFIGLCSKLPLRRDQLEVARAAVESVRCAKDWRASAAAATASPVFATSAEFNCPRLRT